MVHEFLAGEGKASDDDAMRDFFRNNVIDIGRLIRLTFKVINKSAKLNKSDLSPYLPEGNQILIVSGCFTLGPPQESMSFFLRRFCKLRSNFVPITTKSTGLRSRCTLPGRAGSRLWTSSSTCSMPPPKSLNTKPQTIRPCPSKTNCRARSSQTWRLYFSKASRNGYRTSRG